MTEWITTAEFRAARRARPWSAARWTWSPVLRRAFASAAEAERAEQLHLMQAAGEITGLEFQPRYALSKNCRFTLDFRYRLPDGTLVVEDVKGCAARDFAVRRAWLQQLEPTLRVRVVRCAAPGTFEEI